MPTGPATLVLHPALARARSRALTARPARASLPLRAARCVGHLVLALTLVAAGTVALAAALLALLLAAPAAAALAVWLAWRADGGPDRIRRQVRARLRRRARALGLRVLVS